MTEVSTGAQSQVNVKRISLPVDGEPLRIVIERPPFPWARVMIAVAIVCGLLALNWLFVHLGTLLVMLAVAALLAFILDPLVMVLQRRMPRWVGVVVTYLGFVIVFTLLAMSVLPTIFQQLQNLQHNFPRLESVFHDYTDRFNTYLEGLPDQAREQIENVQTTLSESGHAMLRTLFTVMVAALGWVGKGVIILVLSIYLLLDKERVRDGLLGLVPAGARADTVSVMGDVLHVIRAYLRGQIVVIGFVAFMVTAILIWFHFPYALTVGTLAGILEVIPYFGAVAGAVPAVIFAFVHDGVGWGVVMIAFFVALNQCEGHIVIPAVMSKNLEMRPLAVLLALLVGAELGGIVGLIVAVPVARILQVFVEHGIRIYKGMRQRAVEGPLVEPRHYTPTAEAVDPKASLLRDAKAYPATDGGQGAVESTTHVPPPPAFETPEAD